MSGDILFYARDRRRYQFLSNFWPGDRTSLEHRYQAAKFAAGPAGLGNPSLVALILACDRPGDAKRLARLHWEQVRADWHEVNVGIMLELLREKFSHPFLRLKLLATGDRQLVEDSPHDAFWGVGHDGKGQNRLGRLLMQVREEIREEARG